MDEQLVAYLDQRFAEAKAHPESLLMLAGQREILGAVRVSYAELHERVSALETRTSALEGPPTPRQTLSRRSRALVLM